MGDGFTTTTSAAASSFSGLAAVQVASFTFNSAYPKYTPEQLVTKLVKSSGDELRALVGEITNQLYEIIKERES